MENDRARRNQGQDQVVGLLFFCHCVTSLFVILLKQSRGGEPSNRYADEPTDPESIENIPACSSQCKSKDSSKRKPQE